MKALFLTIAGVLVAVAVTVGAVLLFAPGDRDPVSAPTRGPSDAGTTPPKPGDEPDDDEETGGSDEPDAPGDDGTADDADRPGPGRPAKPRPPADTGHPGQGGPGEPTPTPAGIAWDAQAKWFTVTTDRLGLRVDFGSGVQVESLAIDDGQVIDAAAAPTRVILDDGSVVTSADAEDIHVEPTTSGIGVRMRIPVEDGDIRESWHLAIDGDDIVWQVERDFDLDATAELGIETAALAFENDAWQNVRRPRDGGNIPVGGDQLVAAAAEFSAIDALDRNGILLESAPNHAVFDTGELVFLSHDRAAGLAVEMESSDTVTSLMAREGVAGAPEALRSGWRLTDGAIAYANGNPSGYHSRFSERADEPLLDAPAYADGDAESGVVRLSAVSRDDYYAGVDLAGFDNAALAALVNDFGRTIVQGSDIGASSERSFRAGEAPAFTSPWNVWALELIQDPGAFASMRSQIDDIVALPKRNPDDINAPVDGELGGLQDSDGRIHCCAPFGVLNTAQPTYATTDSIFNLVFATATLYNLDPDEAWLEGIADDIRLALDYAERELLIRGGPTAGLFANAQCADPQSVTGCFTDWSEWNDQYDIGQVSAYHNVFAYAALTEWAELEREVLGESARAAHADGLADGIEQAYNRSAAAGGFWSNATDSFAYTRTADGAIAKDCSHLFANGYPLMFGLVDSPARELTLAFSMREQYDRLAEVGHVYDHGAQGGTDYRWRIHGSNPVSCGTGETVEGGYPRMYFPFFEDGGGHLLNEQPAAQISLETGNRATNVDHARTVVERYGLDHFMGWSNIQPDTLLPRRDIWQEPFMVNNVLGVWSLYHDVLGLQPRHDELRVVPAIDASLVGSTIDYRLRGDEPVRVEYLDTQSYAITAATSVPVRVGWQRLPGEELTLTVDGVATTVTADASGAVWADAAASGRHVYALSGSQGIVFDDDAVEFSPEWWQAPGDTFAGGSLRGTSSTGATATLRFTGTGAAVLASVGGDKGIASVTVDGQEVDAGDWYAGSAGHLVRTVAVDGLAPGEHELVLTVSGDHAPASVGTQVTLDAVVVYGGGLTPPDPDAPSATAVHPVNFTYTGGWWGVADPAFLLGELRGTSEAGATVFYTFTGTGITVSGSTGGDKGRARIEIDGVEVGIADWYSTSPGHRVRIFSIDDLEPGQHTITLTVLDTPSPGSVGTQVNLDALLVRTGAW